MTREEAIERLEDTFEAWERWNPHNDSPASKLSEALGMAISALREQPRWISVEERLPEHEQKVLGIDSVGDIETWCFDAEYPSMCRYDGDLRAFDISHWMPLPQAPEVKEE